MWRSRRDAVVDGRVRGSPPHNNQTLVQQSQDGILRPETRTVNAGDAGLLETSSHHLDICGGVTVGCGDLCMSQPSLDRQEIHARLEKLHGEGVPEDVRRDGFVGQLRFVGHSRASPHDVVAPTRQALAVGPDEDRLGS